MKRILITGSRGFTGQYLLAELNNHPHLAPIEFQGDLLDEKNLYRQIEKYQPDAIVHLAGISFVPAADNIKVYQLHTLASEQLLKCAAQNSKVKQVIMASSSVVYGLNPTPQETDCLAPINHYGLSKFAMEQLAKNYQDDLKIVITRPFNYTGRGQAQHFLIPKLIRHFQQKKAEIELGNMHIARDFSDVRWIVKVYAALLMQENIQGSYNLCSGNQYYLRAILAYLEHRSLHMPTYTTNPQFVRHNDLVTQQGSHQKLQNLLPQLETIPFFETLDWMLAQ